MAYVPPHKRHLKDKGRASPTPELLIPHFKRNLNLRSSESNKDRSGKIIYAGHAISKWFPVGLDVNGQFPSDVHLEPISWEPVERKMGEKPLMLVHSNLDGDNGKQTENNSRCPCVTVAETVQQDLLSSFEILRNEMEGQSFKIVKPTLVARFCKIFFHQSPLVWPGAVEKSQISENMLKQLKRSIYTNVPSSYMENIIDAVVPKIGLNFEEEKDIYHVKLSDKTRPDATLSCKCSVKEDKKLLLYKVELNQVRQMVTDISCLDKNLDLRLMLCTKRILTDLTEDEKNSIEEVINSAVLDSDVKGGLRWPLGKTSSGDRYNVIGVWHTIAKAYKSSSVRLKVRHADRFDLRTGTGEVTREIYLKLKGIVLELQERGTQSESVNEMLKDSLRMIWDNFLSCEPF